MAYNRTSHTSTGFSPHQLLFGREIRAPGIPDLLQYCKDGQREDVKALARRLKEAWKMASIGTKKMQQKNKAYYDVKTKQRTFQVGDLVYLANPTFKRTHKQKFAKAFRGPYKIVEVKNPTNYKIKLSSGKTVVAHTNHLKKAYVRQEDLRRPVRRRRRRSSDSDSSSSSQEEQSNEMQHRPFQPSINDDTVPVELIEDAQQQLDQRQEERAPTQEEEVEPRVTASRPALRPGTRRDYNLLANPPDLDDL